jgi:hypothetical protein
MRRFLAEEQRGTGKWLRMSYFGQLLKIWDSLNKLRRQKFSKIYGNNIPAPSLVAKDKLERCEDLGNSKE